MGRTVVEKIIENHTQEDVKPGKVVDVEYDVLMAHDGLVSSVLDKFESLETKIRFPQKLRLYTDHFAPVSATSKPQEFTARANIQKKFLNFAKKYKINANIYQGICHSMLVDDENIRSGDIILGADSHTTTVGAIGALATGIGSTDFLHALINGNLWIKVPETIKVEIKGNIPDNIYGKDIVLDLLGKIGENGAVYDCLEFHDLTKNKIPIDGRSTISNMSVETGAMAGIFVSDNITKKFHEKNKNGYYSKPISPDKDAIYKDIIEIDVSNLEQKVAKPHSPANVVSIDDVVGTKIDQVFIGSCTGGRLDDLKATYDIFSKYDYIADGLKAIIVPASMKIYLNAIKKGYIEEFIKKGAVVLNPSCGPCANIDKGLLADNETAISTSNRNFQGRMGSMKSNVYLSSPLTAAEAAIYGEITKDGGWLK